MTEETPAAGHRQTLHRSGQPDRAFGIRRWIGALVLGVVLSLVTEAKSAVTATQLVLSHETVKAGDTIWAGVRMTVPLGWHIYWRNAGDCGKPTVIRWHLPSGITPGETLWPIPQTRMDGPLTGYVLEGEVLLITPLTVASNLPAGPLEVAADLDWAECSKVCVPAKAKVSANAAIGSESKMSSAASGLEAGKKLAAIDKPDGWAKANWAEAGKGDKRAVQIEWPSAAAGSGGGAVAAEFYPFSGDTYSLMPATEVLSGNPGTVRLRKVVQGDPKAWPKTIAGLAVQRSGSTVLGAFNVVMALAEPASEVAGGATVTSKEASAVSASGGGGESTAETSSEGKSASLSVVLLNLGLGFIGGLILNLMPCVLPVIALKILGFVQQSHGSPAESRRLGLIYGAGVLASLLILAGMVVAVKSANHTASWGMQFQNPYFVVGITTLVTLVALNLFGVFEVTLGTSALGKAGELASREGGAGAFFNGVMAVVLATPCTAPFMGVALGFAFAQPSHVIVLMFASVAIGLASPYVFLSFFPQFLKFLPKPGAWMERFKNAMGFPMLGTAFWLLTLTEAHYGKDGLFWIGIFLVAVAIAAWVWGQFIQRGTQRKGLAYAVAVLFLFGGYGGALEWRLNWRDAAKYKNQAGSHEGVQSADSIQWKPWSRAAVDEAREKGLPIFVDFTADWCAICQANLRTSIDIASVKKRLQELNVVTLKADFTTGDDDDVIAKELRKFGRAGVPLVLVYPKDKTKPPIVLPELLAPSIVLDALDKAAK